MNPDPEQSAPPLDWLRAERGKRSLKTELQRLKRRAKARPVPIFLLALLIVGGLLYRRSRRVPLYRAAVIIRVTENRLLAKNTPRAAKKLDVYLGSVALSNSQLLEIVEKHDLYPLRKVRGNQYAIIGMRSNMKMTFADDYFSTSKRFDTVGRTARVTLYFRDEDPDVAFAVAQDLAAALIRNERERRKSASAKMTEIADAAVQKAEERSLELQRRLSQRAVERRKARREGRTSEVMSLGVDFHRTRILLNRANKILSEAQEQKANVEMALAADAANMGLRFEIVDVRSPPEHERDGPVKMAILGLGLFVCALPLCAIGVGAFDSRLRDTEDLERLDMPVVGHVPAYPGASVGSLRARVALSKTIA